MSMLGTMLLPLDPDVFVDNTFLLQLHQFTQAETNSYERYILTINASWFDSVIDESTDIEYLKNSNRPLVIPLNETIKEEIINRFEKCINCDDNDVLP